MWGRSSFLTADVIQLSCVPALWFGSSYFKGPKKERSPLTREKKNHLQGCLTLKGAPQKEKCVSARKRRGSVWIHMTVCVCWSKCLCASRRNSLLISDISRSLSYKMASLPPTRSPPLQPSLPPTVPLSYYLSPSVRVRKMGRRGRKTGRGGWRSDGGFLARPHGLCYLSVHYAVLM